MRVALIQLGQHVGVGNEVGGHGPKKQAFPVVRGVFEIERVAQRRNQKLHHADTGNSDTDGLHQVDKQQFCLRKHPFGRDFGNQAVDANQHEQPKHGPDNKAHRGKIRPLRDDFRVLDPIAHQGNEQGSQDKRARRNPRRLRARAGGTHCNLGFHLSLRGTLGVGQRGGNIAAVRKGQNWLLKRGGLQKACWPINQWCYLN